MKRLDYPQITQITQISVAVGYTTNLNKPFVAARLSVFSEAKGYKEKGAFKDRPTLGTEPGMNPDRAAASKRNLRNLRNLRIFKFSLICGSLSVFVSFVSLW
jgi:hypothetical protein